MKFDARQAVAAVRSALAAAWAWVKAKARSPGRAFANGCTWVKARARALAAGVMVLPRRAKSVALAVLRYRPSARFWTVVVALPALPLGALLLVGPVRELATGRSFALQDLLTLCWLVTGAATFAAGLGILLRAPAFRVLLQIAFLFSLPLPVAFAARTFMLFLKMRVSTGPLKEELETWVSGGAQLSVLFLAVSGFLAFLLRFPVLRSMPCPGSFLAGRAGPIVGIGLAAATGSGTGYLVWLLFRWLGFTMDIAPIRTIIQAVRVEYFAAAGGLLGAGLVAMVVLRRRGRTTRSPRSAPAKAKPSTPPPSATRSAPTSATRSAPPAPARPMAPPAGITRNVPPGQGAGPPTRRPPTAPVANP